MSMSDSIGDVLREEWRRDRAVVDDVATCFRHEEDEWGEDGGGED